MINRYELLGWFLLIAALACLFAWALRECPPGWYLK
jgi:hypothetical protein